MRPILRLVPLALLLAARPAAASDPSSIYTVPTTVEILPDDATGTQVVIAGAFFFLQSPTSFAYGEPSCGWMSFRCPAGKEAMCRMQWLDIRHMIGQPYCAGFGSLNMVSSARLHPDRASLGTPDPWDLGMGISGGVYVDNKCPKARMLNCATKPPPPPDAAPVPPDAAPPPADAVIPPPADAVVPPSDSAPAPVIDAPVASPDATVPGPDAPVAQPAKSSGCSIGGADAAPFSLLALLLLARRRRR
jgi:MYXO-CTERM domain-containing protein